MIYYTVGYLLKAILSIFGGPIRIMHKRRIVSDEGYIIACTHTGWVDILWLGIAVLPTKIHFMAKKELFESAFVRWLMKALNAFPVDRDNPGPSSIKTPVKLIKDKQVVGIFPSGTRTSEDVPLKRGAVTIANYAKAPIVPAAYVGPNNFKEFFQFKRPRIIFGEPIYLRKDVPKREALEIMAKELDEALRELYDWIK